MSRPRRRRFRPQRPDAGYSDAQIDIMRQDLAARLDRLRATFEAKRRAAGRVVEPDEMSRLAMDARAVEPDP